MFSYAIPLTIGDCCISRRVLICQRLGEIKVRVALLPINIIGREERI